MNKKILITMLAIITSCAMFVGCGDSTTTDSSATTDATVSTETTDNVETDISTDETEELIGDDMLDMENIEITEEEMAQLLGFSGDAESVKEGEMIFDVGTVDIGDNFDILFEASNFEFLYEGDKWLESGFVIDGTEVVLVDSNPVDFESPANIYITPVSQIPSYISINEYLNMVLESSAGAFGVDVLSVGVDLVHGFEVGMIETVEAYTEEVVQALITIGYISQDDLDAIGGMDVLVSLPDMYQVFVVARKGNDTYAVSGAYYENDDKRQNIIDAVDGFLKTLTVDGENILDLVIETDDVEETTDVEDADADAEETDDAEETTGE